MCYGYTIVINARCYLELIAWSVRSDTDVAIRCLDSEGFAIILIWSDGEESWSRSSITENIPSSSSCDRTPHSYSSIPSIAWLIDRE